MNRTVFAGLGSLLLALPVAAADLSALPVYKPEAAVAGTIRNYGFAMGGLLKVWEYGFRRFQPGVTFADRLPTSDAAIPALVTGVADLAPDGGEPTLTETLSFFETYGYGVSGVTVASGAYDVEGKSNGIVVYVHPDNPLRELTLDQLDGIFGAARSAGMKGFEWTPSQGRGAAQDIRVWGQLGLTGDWADKPIHTFGHAPSGTTRFFQWKVLQGGDKWTPTYREYVETGSKMIAPEDRSEQRAGIQSMLRHELLADRYGIAWTVVPQARAVPGLKPLALAPRGGGPAVFPSLASFEDRSYPLVRNIYLYFNHKPGTALDPRLREFLRYVLSRDGQEAVVANGSYLPLPAAAAARELRELDDTAEARVLTPEETKETTR